MNDRIGLAYWLVVSAATITAGCATAKSWNPFAQRDTLPPVVTHKADALPPIATPAAQAVAANKPGNVVVKSIGEEQENRFTAVFRKAGSALSSAFRIESDAGSQGDPTSLSNVPKKLDSNVFEKAAEVLEKRGDLAGAVEQYQRALKEAPNDGIVLVKQARLLARLGEHEAAERSYQRAIQSSADNVLPVHDLGLFYAERGRIDAALTMLAMAVHLAPENRRYRNNFARVLIDAERVSDAVSQLKEVLPPAKAHYNAGFLLRERKQFERAREQLERAIKLDPSLQEAKVLLADLPSADQLTSTGAVAGDAEETLAATSQQDPEEDKDQAQDKDPKEDKDQAQDKDPKEDKDQAQDKDQEEADKRQGQAQSATANETGLQFPKSIGPVADPSASPAPTPQDLLP